MFKGTADKGTQPDWIRGNFSNPTHAVGHLKIERDEIELVVVLPVGKVFIDFPGIDVEEFGEETLLLGRAWSTLSEEIVLVHDTDLFD